MNELLLVVAIFAIVAGIAVPATINVTQALRLGSATREFERELQTARLKAVQTNRRLRVRFNCPTAGQYRRVEVMNAAIDTTSGRCGEAEYPYPSLHDNDPATPAHDGAVHYMGQDITLAGGGATGIEFRPDGRAFIVTSTGAAEPMPPPTPDDAGGACLMMTKGSHLRKVNVNGLGRIQLCDDTTSDTKKCTVE